ncbi:MAG TPA: nucleotide exchange factor GrpE [Burkholderiales bacterium]|nr:nucleotide exchange factor GrpE [Burkholderiales bacterium]
MQDPEQKAPPGLPEAPPTNGTTASGTPVPDADDGIEKIPDLKELLRRAELAAEEHRDAWLRAKAEADNIRKRAQADIANAHKYGIESFASELLAVKDSLEAALATQNATAENIQSGVELTLKQLNAVFERFNLAVIDPAGQKFDPHRHQAINSVESDAEPNTVVQVFQKGYLLNDRVIRPALVAVSKARTVENT